MNCEEARRDLIDLVFGDPDAETGIALNLHLAECADCRAEERRWLELRASARGRAAVPPDALRERIRAALPRRQAQGLASLVRPVPAYALVVAALLGGASVWAGSRFRGPERPPLLAPDPVAQPSAAHEGDPTLFTATGCYATGVGPDARYLLAVDSTGAGWRVVRDSS